MGPESTFVFIVEEKAPSAVTFSFSVSGATTFGRMTFGTEYNVETPQNDPQQNFTQRDGNESNDTHQNGIQLTNTQENLSERDDNE